MKETRLFLLPTPISSDSEDKVITEQLKYVVAGTQNFLAENPREARRFISRLSVDIDISTLHFSQLNKHTPEQELPMLMKPLLEGEDMGLMTDAGCPGIADPGALAVKYAHRHGCQVVPLVGASSLFLALMSSGMSGQRFRFHGYLPVDKVQLHQTIRELERQSREYKETELFIETPYRSDRMMEALVRTLNRSTLLGVARDLTGVSEYIKTLPVGLWKKDRPILGKLPCIFLIMVE